MRRLGLWFVKLLTIVGLTAIIRPLLEPLVVPPSTAEQVVQLPDPEREGREAHLPRPGWSRPKPRTTPPPTYWPALLGLATAFLTWGIISNIFVFVFGLLLVLTCATGWIGDLLDEG